MPVRLLPGRAKLVAKPARTGSPGVIKTIGNAFATDLTDLVNSLPTTNARRAFPVLKDSAALIAIAESPRRTLCSTMVAFSAPTPAA